MIISRYPSSAPGVRSSAPVASAKEIEELAKLVKKVDVPTGPPPPTPPLSRITNNSPADKALFKDNRIQSVEVTREALQIDNPVQWLLLLRPDFKPYRWQVETLMACAGYLTPGKYSPADKTPVTDQNPFLLCAPMANGSGKDMVLIAAFATWFAVCGPRNRVIITSSSFDQTKFQTEPHIRDLITRANSKFGQLFRSTQFHHIVPDLGSEIKLFATDEAGKAEGFHPFDGGQMALVINEAKSVKEEISDALLRCTGYSHRLEISSPGPRSGFMFHHTHNAVPYPSPVVLGQYYFRRVTAFDCPHITPAHIAQFAYDKGVESPQYKSSILAEFSDFDMSNVITELDYAECLKSPPAATGDDIGIGLDLAAGGDENACFVRKGNRIIHSFFFRNPNTDTACLIIDRQLEPWKTSDYTFRADNGGIGKAMIDQLEKLGWSISKTNNQSPAYSKREFLNLGAEMWFYVKRLVQRRDIILTDARGQEFHKLKEQLTTRLFRGFDTTQGKYALESKQEARASGRPSPDRADALVLCFSTYHPSPPKVDPTIRRPDLISGEELLRRERLGTLWREVVPNKPKRFSWIEAKI